MKSIRIALHNERGDYHAFIPKIDPDHEKYIISGIESLLN